MLVDFLRDSTRKERRALMLTSIIAIAVKRVGYPSKIAFFGMDFPNANISDFYVILTSMISYFMFIFLLYSISDVSQAEYDVWRQDDDERKRTPRGKRLIPISEAPLPQKKQNWFTKHVGFFRKTRYVTDILFPLALAISSLIYMWK
jgi:hypothetical protein